MAPYWGRQEPNNWDNEERKTDPTSYFFPGERATNSKIYNKMQEIFDVV